MSLRCQLLQVFCFTSVSDTDAFSLELMIPVQLLNGFCGTGYILI